MFQKVGDITDPNPTRIYHQTNNKPGNIKEIENAKRNLEKDLLH